MTTIEQQYLSGERALFRASDMNITDTIHQMKSLEELGYVRSIEQSYYILSGKNTCI